MDFHLHHKVALISGCSQGLGAACARTLARHGADIFGVSIGDDSSLKKEIEAMGRSYHSLTISLTTPGAIREVMKEALAVYGHIDILLPLLSPSARRSFANFKNRDKAAKLSMPVVSCQEIRQNTVPMSQVKEPSRP